ncbi:hypothetical protein [Anaerotruncus colihominis]|nr:hypothetical protein [Anaerotruncus colihominis]UWN73963.1 hypothetical protein NQ528_12170 [Anaerotruncus colihominis]CUQ03807.1 Uncharacterised protein [Anaerotruncus colihominis]
MQNKESIVKEIETKRRRLELYYKREEEMLAGGVQSYGIGSRNLARYSTDLKEVRDAIQTLEEEIQTLEGSLSGQCPRRALGVVPRDW